MDESFIKKLIENDLSFVEANHIASLIEKYLKTRKPEECWRSLIPEISSYPFLISRLIYQYIYPAWKKIQHQFGSQMKQP